MSNTDVKGMMIALLRKNFETDSITQDYEDIIIYNMVAAFKSGTEFRAQAAIEKVQSLEQRALQAESELSSVKEQLSVAVEALKTIWRGVDPRNGEWSEQFQDTMLKGFTAKTASDFADEILKELKVK